MGGRRSPQAPPAQDRQDALGEPVRLLDVRVPGEDELGDPQPVVLLDPVGDLGVAADQRGTGAAADQSEPGPQVGVHLEAVAVADGPPRLPDGTLAGSALHLDEAVRNVVALGVDPAVAIEAASAVPAAALGDDERGRLAGGRRADLVWWGDDLQVRAVWIGGERIE